MIAAEAVPLLEDAHRRLLLITTDSVSLQSGIDACALRIRAGFDDRFDPLEMVRQGREQLATLFALDDLNEEIASALAPIVEKLANAERYLALAPFSPPPPRPPLMASTDLPQMHGHDRSLVAPKGETKELIGSLQPSGDPRFAAAPLPPLTDAGWDYLRCEDFFGTLARALAHRVPQLGEDFRQSRFLERQALAALDALAAIGPEPLGQLFETTFAIPADPAAIAAFTFLGGCLGGRDGLVLGELAYSKLKSEGDHADAAFEDGLTLVPNPYADSIARALTRSADPRDRALGYSVLIGRRSVGHSELLDALKDVPSVAAAALVPLSIRGSANLREILDEQYREYADPSQPESFRQAYRTACLLCNHGYARTLLWNEAATAKSDAPIWLALVAERRDAEELLNQFMQSMTVPLADALGWAGDPAAIPFLIHALSLEDDELKNSAAAALERITGAGLRELVAIAPERLIDEEAEPAAEANPDSPPEGSPDWIELPSRDPAQWSAFVEANRERLVPGTKTRRGYPFAPLVGWTELYQLACTPRERNYLYFELMLRSGVGFEFSTSSFVSQQEHDLEEVRPFIESANGTAGSWTRPSHRTYVPTKIRGSFGA